MSLDHGIGAGFECLIVALLDGLPATLLPQPLAEIGTIGMRNHLSGPFGRVTSSYAARRPPGIPPRLAIDWGKQR